MKFDFSKFNDLIKKSENKIMITNTFKYKYANVLLFKSNDQSEKKVATPLPTLDSMS